MSKIQVTVDQDGGTWTQGDWAGTIYAIQV